VYQIICWLYCIEYVISNWEPMRLAGPLFCKYCCYGLSNSFFFFCSHQPFGRNEKLKFPSKIPYHQEVCVNSTHTLAFGTRNSLLSKIQFVFWPWPVDSTKRNADFRRVFRKASKQVLPDNDVEHTSRKATVVHTFVSSSVFLCIHISFDPNFLYKYSRSANTRTNCRLDQLYHTHSLQ